MDKVLQAMGIRFTQSAHGYAGYMTAQQYSALWRLPGVVVTEASRSAVRCHRGRVTWGLFVRWTFENVAAAGRAA